MMQPPDQVVRKTVADISVLINDGGGSPLAGLVSSDVRVTYLKQDGLAFAGKTLLPTEFKDRGFGRYDITFSELELDTEGTLIVRVTPDPAYVGTMQQSTKQVFIAEGDTTLAGQVQDRAAWVPVLLELSGTPVGGLTFTAFSSSRVKKPDGSFTSLTLTASNFRELLDIGNPTGVYQIYLPHTYFDQVGTLTVELDGAAFGAMAQSYYIVTAITRRVFIEVVDRDNSDLFLAGVFVHATNLTTGLVMSTKMTDAIGQLVMDLPDDEYRLTLTKGTQIFQENNLHVQVWNPDDNYSDALAAEIFSGDPGPYVLEDGDTLQFQINDGELQLVDFEATDFVPPATIQAATAEYVAGIMNTLAHSMVASAGGLNNKHLRMETLIEGSTAKIEVVGGTAQSKFNFPSTPALGRDRTRMINSFQLNGSSFVPPFPVPDTDTVEFTYRVVDLEGRPVEGAEVNISNKFSPTVRASDGVSSVLGRKVLQFFTDADGYLQDPVMGKPRLLKGAAVDVILKGTGIVRAITVPQTDFTLMDEVEQAEDLFTIQTPNLPPAPRS